MTEAEQIRQLTIIKNVCSRVPRYKHPEIAAMADWYLKQAITHRAEEQETEQFIKNVADRYLPEHFLW
ncbi:MAG: hypothetical protein IKQ27_08775 [Lachnospiraceae bacterium]|nr:hypothetical protein [Lachnospiraceae bacterium]MBR3736572.1 hypothetical protein [Lachnospiraceae bacterium]MBR6157039.1 hypothetical protein [Lachnospiraceae bacterium]